MEAPSTTLARKSLGQSEEQLKPLLAGEAARVLPALPLTLVALKVLQLLHKLRRLTPRKAEDELESKLFSCA